MVDFALVDFFYLMRVGLKMIKKLLLLNLFFVHLFTCADQRFDNKVRLVKDELKNVEISEDVNTSLVAHLFDRNIDIILFVQAARRLALSEGCQSVEMRHFNEVLNDCTFGLKKLDATSSSKELERIAYHEAGHAVVAAFMRDRVVHKVLTDCRERNVGCSFALPVSGSRPNYWNTTESSMADSVAVALAGGIAEKLFNKVDNYSEYKSSDDLLKLLSNSTVGGGDILFSLDVDASLDTVLSFLKTHPAKLRSDLECALASSSHINQVELIKRTLGAVMFAATTCGSGGLLTPYVIFFGATAIASFDDTAQKESLYNEYNRAREILTTHKNKVDLVAQELIEKRSLSGDRVYEIVGVERPIYHFEESVGRNKS